MYCGYSCVHLLLCRDDRLIKECRWGLEQGKDKRDLELHAVHTCLHIYQIITYSADVAIKLLIIIYEF